MFILNKHLGVGGSECSLYYTNKVSMNLRILCSPYWLETRKEVQMIPFFLYFLGDNPEIF